MKPPPPASAAYVRHKLASSLAETDHFILKQTRDGRSIMVHNRPSPYISDRIFLHYILKDEA